MPKEYNFFGENDTFGKSVACVPVVSMREIDLRIPTAPSCLDPESFVRGVPISTTFFSYSFSFLFWLVGGEDPKPTKNAIIDPPAKRHLNGFAGLPMMAQH